MTVSAFCMLCRVKREMVKPQFVTTKTGNKAAKGQCKKCSTNMYAMLPKTGVQTKSKKSKKSSKSKKSKKGGKSKKSKKSKKSRK